MIANIIGFTGSRNELAKHQGSNLMTFVQILNCTEFHNGDCIGADLYAASYFAMCRDVLNTRPKPKLVIHPPNIATKRAFINKNPRIFIDGDIVLTEKPYLERNKDIVDASDLLIACPDDVETVRSGTWSTVRYARKMNKTIFIIQPSGLLTVEVPK